MIHPVMPQQAEGKVAENYYQLVAAFQSLSLPAFFTFYGAFPEYLAYITEQLQKNLLHPKFNLLVDQISSQFEELIFTLPEIDNQRKTFLNENAAEFEVNLYLNQFRHIFVMNVKLAFFCIAIREAVKGWAIAAKKLSSSNNFKSVNQSVDDYKFAKQSLMQDYPLAPNHLLYHASQTTLAPGEKYQIVRNLLSHYITLSQSSFSTLLKSERYILIRVNLEKLILASLGLLPELIFSPINITLDLIKKYDNYSEFLYLLCEQFPTASIQRVILSGYMMKKL